MNDSKVFLKSNLRWNYKLALTQFIDSNSSKAWSSLYEFCSQIFKIDFCW